MVLDCLLKLDPKVEGESKDEKHKGEIEIRNCIFGVSNEPSPLQGGGSGAGKSVPEKFMFDKHTDKSTPLLAQVAAAGDHFNSAIITVRKAGGSASEGQKEYLIITLTDVFISKYGVDIGEVPNERLCMTYTKMVLDYKEQKADGSLMGSVKLGYDWKKMAKV